MNTKEIKRAKARLKEIEDKQEKLGVERDKLIAKIEINEGKSLLESKILSTFEWTLDSYSATICCKYDDCHEALKPYLSKGVRGDFLLLDKNISLREHDSDISISYYPCEDDYKHDITNMERTALIGFINKYKLPVVFSELDERIKEAENTIAKMKELKQYYMDRIK